MNRNVNREPSQKDAIVGILKFTAGLAALFTGAYVLSRSARFVGEHFQTVGLTPEQIAVMDEHNRQHGIIETVEIIGNSLISVLDVDKKYVSPRIKQAKADLKVFFDGQIEDLPGALAHKH